MNAVVIAYEKGYRVDEEGRLISPFGSADPKIAPNGYKRFTVRVGDRKKDRKLMVNVHRLAAYQYFGDEIFRKGIDVRHLDGDRTNNSKKNLAIGTRSENMMDRPAAERLAHAIHAASFR